MGAAHVKKAVAQQRRRSSKYDEEMLELYTDGTLMIDTDGWMTGQVNGLAVLDMGDVAFGKPSRITAATYMGKSGIVDIEREVETGGDTHTKGFSFSIGYIGNRFAQELPLSLTAPSVLNSFMAAWRATARPRPSCLRFCRACRTCRSIRDMRSPARSTSTA